MVVVNRRPPAILLGQVASWKYLACYNEEKYHSGFPWHYHGKAAGYERVKLILKTFAIVSSLATGE